MRKLASVQKIVSVEPIEGADRIELATVLGWHVVVTKADNYKPGDLCIYIEIDSKIPLELLDKVGLYDTVKQKGMLSKSKGDVLKTKRLRKIYSQGLIVPLSVIETNGNIRQKLEEGYDVTELLGITKYEPNPDNAEPVVTAPTFMDKVRKFLGIKKQNRTRGFPSFFPKTDETRVQNLGHMLPKLHGTMVYVTEKADGSSASFYYHKGLNQFGVCSRNLTVYQKNFEKTMKDHIINYLPFTKKWLSVVNDANGGNYNDMAKKLDLENKMKALGLSLAIQGELIGPGIQQNKYGLTDFRYVVFSVYDILRDEYLSYNQMEIICDQLGLERVPLLDRFTFGPEHTIDHMVDMAKGKSVINNSGVIREGIVVRPVDCQNIAGWTKCSFKSINQEFLIKFEE